MNLLIPILISSLTFNFILVVRLLILKSDLEQERKTHAGSLMEKARLRNIIKKINLN